MDSLFKLLLIVGVVVASGTLFTGEQLLAVWIYRLYLHPLARYPGPFLAKVTNLYAAYHSWKGDMHIDMWRCHEIYGDYIRYGPDRLIFNTPTALKEIYSFGQNVQKCKGYLTMMHRVPNTITQRNKALHARQRRILSNGFSDAKLRSYESIITAHVENFSRHLAGKSRSENHDEPDSGSEHWSEALDMSIWCDYLTFDIMLEVVYGSKSEMVNKPDNRSLIEAIAKSNVRVGVLMPLYYLKGTFLERYLFPGSIVARYTFIAFVKSLLKDKKARSHAAERPSVYSVLMDSNGGEGLEPNQIAAESTNLIVAGSDTTSTVLAACFFYLRRSNSAYAKATKEIRTLFTSTTELSDSSKLNKCAYLRACLDESMRMAPPVASALFREVEDGGACIDGHHIPAGYDIGTCIYSIQHSAANFADPFTFVPERWLSDAEVKSGLVAESDAGRVESEERIKRAKEALTPFSFGPRSCIGKSLAMMELMRIMAGVIYRFDWRIADGKAGRLGEGALGNEWGRHRQGEFQLYDHLTAAKKGPVLQFRRVVSSGSTGLEV